MSKSVYKVGIAVYANIIAENEHCIVLGHQILTKKHKVLFKLQTG